ncbi:hypothetical protein Mucpa_0169 [Mucilaginibacter paludis DSM 18603]|uniref:Uncharacterized protein n=1 Tax=Mucilaginibacter paludis DSM 18603 TaxID=714943 RepID=H1YEV2_9SPHI|nr:hypothetical protein Mucpa_0169 [Mucilaginibacter paludis DSM 18603]
MSKVKHLLKAGAFSKNKYTKYIIISSNSGLLCLYNHGYKYNANEYRVRQIIHLLFN